MLNVLFKIFNVFEYRVWTSHEIKTVGETLKNPAPKKGKSITTETLHLVTNVYEDGNFSRTCLKRKTILVWVREYIIKNFVTCKSLYSFPELYTTFKEKHQNVNIGFSKFCALRPKWCVLAASKMTHSVCVCSTHQNVVLLVDTVNRTCHTKTWSRRLFASQRAINA